MPGAGKSEAGQFFHKQGLPVLRLGSVIDEGIKAEGLAWSPETNTYYREKIRREFGMAAVAIKMLPKIEEALKTHTVVILDGLYSWEEYIFLKEKLPNLKLLCIYARPEIRYKRLAERSDRPFNLTEARKRDEHEIEAINKGGPIAIADYLVKNETTRAYLEEELELILKEVRQ